MDRVLRARRRHALLVVRRRVSFYDGTVKCWDAATGALLRTLVVGAQVRERVVFYCRTTSASTLSAPNCVPDVLPYALCESLRSRPTWGTGVPRS